MIGHGLGRQILSACLLLTMGASVSSAQTDGTFAVGANVAVRGGPADDTLGRTGAGLLWRLGHGRDGWGWRYGFGWYSADLLREVGTERAESGRLRVRPILAGYGYSHRFGRTSLTAQALGGFSINSFEPAASVADTYRRVLGWSPVTTRVSDGLVLKPELSAWIDLGRKVGLNISTSYTVARPTVTVSSALGSDAQRIRADVVTLKVGAVYSVF